MNPLQQITKSIPAEAKKNIAESVDVSPSAVDTALDALAPELFQGMFQKMKAEGPQGLLSILGGKQPANAGDALLENILGETLNDVLEKIAHRAGVTVGQARAIASKLTPVIIESLSNVGAMDPKMVSRAMGMAKMMGINLDAANVPGQEGTSQPQEKKKGWFGGLLGGK